MVYLRTMKVMWDQTYKKSLIGTLLFRCFSICSDYTSFHLEVENLREILKKNSYPSGIIEQFIRSFLNRLHVLKKVIPTVPKKELFIALSYLGMLSSNLKHLLSQCRKYTWFRTWCLVFQLCLCNKIIFRSFFWHFRAIIGTDMYKILPKMLKKATLSNSKLKIFCY